MDIEIRRALLSDAYDYTVCHIACWQAAYRGIIPDEYLDNMTSELEGRVGRMEQAMTAPGDYDYYCVMNEGRMVGRLISGKSRDEDKPGAGEVMAIYLLPEFWGGGHGKSMMDFAVGELKRMGYNEIFLWVLEDNGRARRFYEKCGFAFDGTRKEIVVGEPLIELRYVLNV